MKYRDYDESGSLTRRGFFKLMSGAMATLPAVAGVEGGFLVPSVALAEGEEAVSETYGGEYISTAARVYIVRSYEVGFYVTDMADARGKKPVEGARISVTSLYNGRHVEGITNKDGVAALDIRALAENEDELPLDELPEYMFDGTIQVSCDGYRSFESPRTIVAGGESLVVPTREIDTAASGMAQAQAGTYTPYPSKVAFDGWDVMYTDYGATLSQYNNKTHTLDIEIQELDPTKPVTIQFIVNGESKPRRQTKVLPEGGSASAHFEGKFLKEGHEDALPEGASLSILYTQADDITKDFRTVGLKLDVQKGKVDRATMTAGVELRPFDLQDGSGMDGSMFLPDWPDWVPLVGGQQIDIPLPDLPVSVYLDPSGFLQIKIASPSYGYVNESSSTDSDSDDDDDDDKDWTENGKIGWRKNGWENMPIKNFGKAYKKSLSDVGDQWSNMKNHFPGFKSLGGVGKTSKTVSATVSGEALLLAQWYDDEFDEESGELLYPAAFEGGLGFTVIMAFNASLTWNVWVWIFPILISVGLEMSLEVSFMMGASSEPDDDFSGNLWKLAVDFDNWKWDTSNTGIDVTFNFAPFLSIGLGVKGFSVSLRGKITITLYFGIARKLSEAEAAKHGQRHITAGAICEVGVVFEAFLFSKYVKIATTGSKLNPFYDSWRDSDENKKKAMEAQNSGIQSLAESSFEDFMAEMNIITEQMLSHTTEQAGFLPITAAADDEEPFDWEATRLPDVEEPMDDGNVMKYTVYELPTTDEFEQSVNDMLKASASANQAAELGERSDGAVALGAEATDGVVALGEDADAEKAEVGIVAADAQDAVQTKAKPHIKVASPVVYEPVSDGLTAMVSQDFELPDLSVKSLGRLSGIVPGADKTVAANVYGDSRVKICEFSTRYTYRHDRVENGHGHSTFISLEVRIICAFRIGTVTVNGKTRTRLICDLLDLRNEDGERITGKEIEQEGKSQVELYKAYKFVRDRFEKNRTRVIDFNIDSNVLGVSREDIYDYDFDITSKNCSYKGGASQLTTDSDLIQVVISSGKRSNNDATNIASVATDLAFSYLSINTYDFLDSVTYVTARTFPAKDVMGSNPYAYHMISSLNCVSGDNETVLVSFLDRASMSQTGVFSTEVEKTQGAAANDAVHVLPGFFIIDTTVSVRQTSEFDADRINDPTRTDSIFLFYKLVMEDAGRLYIPTMESVDLALKGWVEDASIYQIKLLPKIADYYTVQAQGSVHTHFFVFRLKDSGTALAEVRYGGFYDIDLVPWQQNNCYLASILLEDENEALDHDTDETDADHYKWDGETAKRQLAEVWWNWDNPTEPHLEYAFVGKSKFAARSLSINSTGTFVFWTQGRNGEGTEGVVYGNGGQEFEENENLDTFQLMACRVNNEAFSDPFVAAELTHDLVNPQLLTTNVKGAPLEILTKELVEDQKGQDIDNDGQPILHVCNINYTGVPNVLAATAIGCSTVNPIVTPGAKSYLDIYIRNDGNTFLKSCKVQMYEHMDLPEGARVLTDEDGKMYVNVTEGGKSVRYEVIDVVEWIQEEDEAGNKGDMVKLEYREMISPVEKSFATIEFGENTLVQSGFNPVVDDKFANVEKDWSLAPGKTSLYRALIPIPESWLAYADSISKEEQDIASKKVSFIAYEPTMVDHGGLAGLADGDDLEYITYVAKPGEVKIHTQRTSMYQDPNRSYMTVMQVSPFPNDQYLSDAPILVNSQTGPNGEVYGPTTAGGAGTGAGGAGGNGAQGSDAGVNGGTTALGDPLDSRQALEASRNGGAAAAGADRTATAKTGDATSGLLPAALAAAGAAAVAYSRRRARNEADAE